MKSSAILKPRSHLVLGAFLAPSLLSAGETWTLMASNGFNVGVHSLWMNSASDGMWLTQNTGAADGISTSIVQYTRLLITPNSSYSSGATNQLLLLFQTANQGLFQPGDGISSTPQLGLFIRTLP